MTAKIDHDRDIEDLVPLMNFYKTMKDLKNRGAISNYGFDSDNLYVTPIPNIEKIDLDPRKTVVLKCLEGIC